MPAGSAARRHGGGRLIVDIGIFAPLQQRFADRFSAAQSVREQHGRGEAHHGARLPDAVVFARSTEEVADIVRFCAAHALPVIAFGAGTSLEGNVAALKGGVTIDLSQMNRVLRVSPADLDCTVEAGVTRSQLNAFLRDTGLFFPIDPGADATLGGMASTRASGTNAVRYGTMREAVLSLTVVLADGRIIRTARRARKSSAGYDLTRLFIGSEGTLGIITEVTLRLHGIPEAIFAAVCPFETLAGAVDTAIAVIQSGVPVARIELLDDVQMRAVNAYSKASHKVANTLFFEFHGTAASVAEQAELARAIAADNGGTDFRSAGSPEERSKLWQARHEAYYAAVAMRPNARGWATDVCVPISRLAECILAVKEDLKTVSVPAAIVGHVGDGNFHVVFAVDPDSAAELAEVSKVSSRMVEQALACDGTCTGEHGVGTGKIPYMRAEHGEAVEVMRLIKQALDPGGILNPGKILPPA
jgi:D-lactate dehydrogenase (cytochrome)